MTHSGPDFVVPGASKSGTTSLYHYLDEHDDIFLPEGKELHFFDRNSNYEAGLAAYESNFPGPEDGRVAGDITPSYFCRGIVYERRSHWAYKWCPDDDAPTRIQRAYPDVNIILTLRNPLTRAYSQFWKNYRQGRERADSFINAIRAELEGRRDHETDPSCWVYRNRYPVHVGHWLDLFDRDQIKILVFEEWINNPEQTLNSICEFLGIQPRESWSRTDETKNVGGEPRFVALNRFYQDYIQKTALGRLLQKYRVTHALDALNSSDGYPEMSEEAIRLLTSEVEPEIDKLESMLDTNLDLWRNKFDV